MATFKNQVKISGTLEDFDFAVKEYKDKSSGEPYNAMVGSLTLNTGDQSVNLQGFYRELNKDGSTNQQFSTISNWLQNPEAFIGKNYMTTTSISSSAFKNQAGDLIEATQIRASFLNDRNTGVPRAEFTTDLLLTAQPVEEIYKDEPTGRYVLNANIFDYRDVCFPAKFIIETEAAYDYFVQLDASQTNPVLIEVWGKVINNLIHEERETESAFGDTRIEIFESTKRENVITGAAIEPKEITDELFKIIQDGRKAYEVSIAALDNQQRKSGFTADTSKKDTTPKVDRAKTFEF